MDLASAGGVRLRLFAHYAEVLGADELFLEVPLPATVAAVVAHLKARHPAAAVIPDRPLAAINLHQVSAEHLVQAGDELALLPPVAGG